MSDLDRDAKEQTDKLHKWTFDNIDSNSESYPYALMQMFHDFVLQMEISEEEKGGIVSDIITALGESYKEELALYNLQRQAMFDIKGASIH